MTFLKKAQGLEFSETLNHEPGAQEKSVPMNTFLPQGRGDRCGLLAATTSLGSTELAG